MPQSKTFDFAPSEAPAFWMAPWKMAEGKAGQGAVVIDIKAQFRSRIIFAATAKAGQVKLCRLQDCLFNPAIS
ncbi:MAG: hypothetical protein EOP81_04530 [Variovorax sp.]|nr:MAG: hypothetical protein EOP81_04530 [Variovorax sp.]